MVKLTDLAEKHNYKMLAVTHGPVGNAITSNCNRDSLILLIQILLRQGLFSVDDMKEAIDLYLLVEKARFSDILSK